MPRKIVVDPLSRVEGHLSVSADVVSDIVVACKISGDMYRGFESFLLGRHPFDAARISQRVCGVCHEVHGVASVKALEQIYGIRTPANGVLLRDVLLGLNLISDHLFHFYSLLLPDYIDYLPLLKSGSAPDSFEAYARNLYKGSRRGHFISDVNKTKRFAENMLKCFSIRSEAAKAMALIGAKAPFAHALMPGGLTTHTDHERLISILSIMEKVKDFLENEMMEDHEALADEFGEYFNIGVSYNNFLAAPGFDSFGEALFKGGALVNGKREDYDVTNVFEETESSYYDNSGAPIEEKDGAYSWIKSPRYRKYAMEAGPLARLVLNDDERLKQLSRKYGGGSVKSSVMHRILARGLDSCLIINKVIELVQMVDTALPNVVTADVGAKVSGIGIGVVNASRGALVHKITVDKGIVTGYDMVMPSTWNFGPTSSGTSGVVERAIVGLRLEGTGFSDDVTVGRIIRSFDPCTACSIH